VWWPRLISGSVGKGVFHGHLSNIIVWGASSPNTTPINQYTPTPIPHTYHHQIVVERLMTFSETRYMDLERLQQGISNVHFFHLEKHQHKKPVALMFQIFFTHTSIPFDKLLNYFVVVGGGVAEWKGCVPPHALPPISVLHCHFHPAYENHFLLLFQCHPLKVKLLLI
jgi:hypothetical protein